MDATAFGYGAILNLVLCVSLCIQFAGMKFTDIIDSTKTAEKIKCESGDYDYEMITPDEETEIAVTLMLTLVITLSLLMRVLHPFCYPHARQLKTITSLFISVVKFNIVLFVTGQFEVITFRKNWSMTKWYLMDSSTCHDVPEFVIHNVLCNMTRLVCVYFHMALTVLEVYLMYKFHKHYHVPNPRLAIRRILREMDENRMIRLQQPFLAGHRERHVETPPPSYEACLRMIETDGEAQEGMQETDETPAPAYEDVVTSVKSATTDPQHISRASSLLEISEVSESRANSSPLHCTVDSNYFSDITLPTGTALSSECLTEPHSKKTITGSLDFLQAENFAKYLRFATSCPSIPEPNDPKEEEQTTIDSAEQSPLNDITRDQTESYLAILNDRNGQLSHSVPSDPPNHIVISMDLPDDNDYSPVNNSAEIDTNYVGACDGDQ